MDIFVRPESRNFGVFHTWWCYVWSKLERMFYELLISLFMNNTNLYLAISSNCIYVTWYVRFIWGLNTLWLRLWHTLMTPHSIGKHGRVYLLANMTNASVINAAHSSTSTQPGRRTALRTWWNGTRGRLNADTNQPSTTRRRQTGPVHISRARKRAQMQIIRILRTRTALGSRAQLEHFAYAHAVQRRMHPERVQNRFWRTWTRHRTQPHTLTGSQTARTHTLFQPIVSSRCNDYCNYFVICSGSKIAHASTILIFIITDRSVSTMMAITDGSSHMCTHTHNSSITSHVVAVVLSLSRAFHFEYSRKHIFTWVPTSSRAPNIHAHSHTHARFPRTHPIHTHTQKHSAHKTKTTHASSHAYTKLNSFETYA